MVLQGIQWRHQGILLESGRIIIKNDHLDLFTEHAVRFCLKSRPFLLQCLPMLPLHDGPIISGHARRDQPEFLKFIQIARFGFLMKHSGHVNIPKEQLPDLQPMLLHERLEQPGPDIHIAVHLPDLVLKGLHPHVHLDIRRLRIAPLPGIHSLPHPPEFFLQCRHMHPHSRLQFHLHGRVDGRIDPQPVPPDVIDLPVRFPALRAFKNGHYLLTQLHSRVRSQPFIVRELAKTGHVDGNGLQGIEFRP